MKKIGSTNILIFTNWSIDDPLVEAYVLPYVKIIRKHLLPCKKISIYTLDKASTQEDEKVCLIKDGLSRVGIKCISNKYYKFGFQAVISAVFNLIRLSVYCRSNEIGVIHVWCTPAGVTGYLLSLLTGAKLVIDSYEPHAESMVENKSWKYCGLKFSILFFFEKLMSHRAAILISLTEGMKNYASTKYGLSSDKFYVKPACVDLNLFNLCEVKNLQLMRHYDLIGKIVMIYVGKFGGIYLDNEIFDFANCAHKFFGESFRFLLLTSQKKEDINKFCLNAGIPSGVVIAEYIEHKNIPLFMGMADFAITPVKPVPSKRYCSPLKDAEYWALGLPVVITKDISDDSSIIEREDIGAVLSSFDKQGYELACQKIRILLDSDRDLLRLKIRGTANKYRNFEIADKIYSKIYS
jgi:hypothetical protein